MDIIQLVNKNKNQFKRTIYILKILLACKYDEENYNKLMFVERIYDSLGDKVTKYEESNETTDYNILCNDYSTVESMLGELKEDVVENFRISSVLVLDNLKLDELTIFYENFTKIMSNYQTVEQASSDIFYYSGKEMSSFITRLVNYVNTHDIPNKRLIPLSYLESHETIITISLQDWITLFKNIHTAMKYVNNYNDEEINKLKKDFAFLNVYYFIILTGGNN